MFVCAFIVLAFRVFSLKSEDCVTPDHQQGSCISLYTCPKLIGLLAKQKDGEEYVRKSRCGSKPTEPLVCCPHVTPSTCTTPNNKEGKCVYLSSCPELLKALETQQTDSIEYVRKSTCEVTKSDVLVCCTLDSPDKQHQGSTQSKHDALIPSRKYCGYQHSDDYNSKIQGADITDFPWLVGLYYKFKDGREKVNCQGTIINARYVLTAAHCVVTRSEVTLTSIRLGEYNIKNSTDCVEVSGYTECSDPVQEYGAEEITIHPQYNQHDRSAYFDIALVRLSKSIEAYSDYIRPICLPLPEVEAPKPGSRLITTGWGSTSKNSNSEVKKKVLNKLITNQNCSYIYKDLSIRISEHQMCTQELSDNIEFACSGDSGGPVMFSHNLQWFIEGVNSYGSTKCGDKYPIVHTRVSYFLDWIRGNMKMW